MKDVIAFRPTEAHKKAIEKRIEETGLNESDVVRNLIDKALNMEKQDEPSDDECPAFTKVDDQHFYCVWARIANTPLIKLIGKNLEDAKSTCRACKATLKATGKIDELEALKEQTKKGIIVTIPTCSNYGSRVNENMERIYCPKIGKERPIKIEYRKKNDYIPCNREDHGRPCRHLRLTETTIKGKLPEMDGQNL